MSESAFILDTDRALAGMLWSHLKSDGAVKEVVNSQNQVVFSQPKPDQAGKLSIYLYNITVDSSTRNSPIAGPDERRAAETPFLLHYLICPCTGDAEKDHALLGSVIGAVLASPVIVAKDSEVKVTLDSLAPDELSRLWLALGTPLMPAVNITIAATKSAYSTVEPQTLSAQTTEIHPERLKLYEAVKKTFNEQYSDWKNRSIFRRQYILQDFKTTTGIAAEDMQAALNNLSETSRKGPPTTEAIEALEALTKFYEHQHDALKGMSKFSAKQKANVAMIEGWISDVNALKAALTEK